jgi:ABC-2 type transport system permease protein
MSAFRRVQVWTAGALAVASREVRSMLGTPLGWSVLAAFALLSGSVFALAVLHSGAPATLRGSVIAMGWGMLALAPALTMRMVAEERRQGTWPALLAAPAGASAAIAGKFIGAVVMLAMAVVVPMVAQLAALEVYAQPDYGEVATAALGLLLAGAAYAATGLLMSALTGNQVGAYLLTVFLWLTWMVAAKSAPALLPGRAAFVGFALDPLRRLDDFLLGLLDTGNVAFFAVISAWCVWAAAAVSVRPTLPARLAGAGRAVVSGALAALLAVALVGMANAPRAAALVDMTKTRAYTLAEPTRALLAEVEGDWTVAVVLSNVTTSPEVVRQVDEVLERMGESSAGRVRTVRVDPDDPADSGRFEEVLERVQAVDAPARARYEPALAEGVRAFDALAGLAAREQTTLAEVVRTLPADSQDRVEIESLRAAFAQLTAQKGAFDASLRELRTASPTRPFADDARAAQSLAANLRHWSEELQGAARALSARQRERVDSTALAAWLEGAVPAYLDAARQLRAAQDALEQLPPLAGAEVGAALAAGDAALIIGPPGVAVVPGAQMVAGGGGGDRGGVSFDRRFRGEQMIAAAMRGMRSRSLPVAVFVHGGSPGALRARPDHADFAAAADALRSARFDVREWVPGEGPEPTAPAGRPMVWIVIPPMDRDGVREGPRDRVLLQAAERLVQRGEPVLLSVGPSLLPLLGQADSWAVLLASRGLTADSGRSVLQLVPTGPGRAQTVVEQLVRDFAGGHPIGSAVDGQLARFDRVAPVVTVRDQDVIASIEPSGDRWIEDDWRRDFRQRLEPPQQKLLIAPATVVAASQVQGAAGPMRAVLVGSPTWLSSTVADAADSLGGGRVALRYPGNRELLVNAVAWLAGRDELVAGAGSGREVSRLPRLSRGERIGVGVAEALGVPAVLAAMGAVVVLRRRWRT